MSCDRVDLQSVTVDIVQIGLVMTFILDFQMLPCLAIHVITDGQVEGYGQGRLAGQYEHIYSYILYAYTLPGPLTVFGMGQCCAGPAWHTDHSGYPKGKCNVSAR